MMRKLLIYPHGLGDLILLTPAIRALAFTSCPPVVMMQERFKSSKLLDHNPYVHYTVYCKDPWNDYQHSVEGFRKVELLGRQVADESDLEPVVINHSPGGSKIIDNYTACGMDQAGSGCWKRCGDQTEVFSSTEDVRTAEAVIAECVGDNPFGFVQTSTGVPAKDLPDGYGAAWLRASQLAYKVIEVGKDFEAIGELSINVQFEIMRRADAVCLPDSVFYHACGAMNKPVDLVYFGRGEGVYNRVKPLHPTATQNITYSLETL